MGAPTTLSYLFPGGRRLVVDAPLRAPYRLYVAPERPTLALGDRASTQRRLVERDQLAPGSLGIQLVVDGLPVLNRHIRHAPAVHTLVDLDLGRNSGVGKGLLQLVFGVRLASVVVGCD